MPGLYSLATLAITSSLASAVEIAQYEEYPFMTRSVRGDARASTLICLMCLSGLRDTDDWIAQFCTKQEEQISDEYASTFNDWCAFH